MKRIVLIFAVTMAAMLASPFAASAFAKDRQLPVKAQVTITCVCPDGTVCTHTLAEYIQMKIAMLKTGECPEG